MGHIMSWCGFLGAWLLVAGPLDQAVRELEEQDFEHEAIKRAMAQVGEPEQVNSWWMLVPPVWCAVAASTSTATRSARRWRTSSSRSLRESYGRPEWTWAVVVLLALVICGATTKSAATAGTGAPP